MFIERLTTGSGETGWTWKNIWEGARLKELFSSPRAKGQQGQG